MAVTNVVGHQIVDMLNDANYYFEVAPQGDSQSRFVEVEILQNGVPYDVPAASTVILEGKNAGGYNIFNPCVQAEQSNVIEVPLTDGVLSFAGVGKYSIGIYSGNTYITSFSFNIVVTEAPYDIVALQASDSYEALNELIAKAADSNRWVVGEDAPPTECETGTRQNDYYLDSSTGNIYIAVTNFNSDSLNWQPLINSITGYQLNILEKTYIRYADDDIGTNMSTSPVGKTYIGFYETTNPSTAEDVGIASNYIWSLMRITVDSTNSTNQYAQTDDGVNHPTTGWQNSPPTAIAGKYMWTKCVVAFSDNSSSTYYSVSKNGINAGISNSPTSSIVPSLGKSSISVTASGADTSKEFYFSFNLRGAEWKSGTEFTGTGTITSTTYNNANTIIGDMYINNGSGVDKGQVYRCTAVTDNNSTWVSDIKMGLITNIAELDNTYRFRSTLSANSSTVTITASNLDTTVFNTTDASGSTYQYFVKILVSNQTLNLLSAPLTIGDGTISITLTFSNSVNTATDVCVEIIKKTV